MRRRELLIALAGLALGVVLCGGMIVGGSGSGDPSDGLEDEDVICCPPWVSWLVSPLPIVGGLGYVAVVRRVLRKQEVPVWCSENPSVAGRRRFHRFEDTGEKDRWNIFECSVCGVRRELVVGDGGPSTDLGGD